MHEQVMATALDRCLAQQVALARRLLAALQLEAHHLQTPTETTALHASTRDKLACVQAFEAALADFKAVRDQALVALGYAQSSHQTDEAAWAQALQDRPDWAQTLQTVHTLAEQARQLNAQNGITLQSCLRHTRHALLDLQQFKPIDSNTPSSNPAPGHHHTAQPLYTARGRVRLAAPAGLNTGIQAG